MAITGKLRGGALIRARPSYYSAEQVAQYLERVDWLEGTYTAQDIANGRFPANLDNLAILIRRHFLSFCMDHTPMHYSAEHNLDVSPEGTFKRLVVDRTGGTYCYGHNGLMLGVLRALGYRAYTGVARMNLGFFGKGGPAYAVYGHMVIFVQLGEGHAEDPAHTWLVDVAPGPPAPILPMPLSDDPKNVLPGASSGEENRLTKGFHPESSLVIPSPPGSLNTNGTTPANGVNGNGHAPSPNSYTASQATAVWESHSVWQLEYRAGEDSPLPDFVSIYQFMEEEYFAPDYAALHFTKMYKPFEDVFWNDIVSFRYVLADKDVPGAEDKKITERPLGRVSLFRGSIKHRYGRQVLESVTLHTEEERVAALKKYFDITVDVKDIQYIKGRDASLEKVERMDLPL